MRTVEEIRLERLRALVTEAGSIANLNRKAERNERDATISQILNRWTGKSGKPKELGSDMARELEAAMGKPRGWMDNDPGRGISSPWPFDSVSHDQYAALSERQKGELEGRILAFLEDAAASRKPLSPTATSQTHNLSQKLDEELQKMATDGRARGSEQRRRSK